MPAGSSRTQRSWLATEKSGACHLARRDPTPHRVPHSRERRNMTLPRDHQIRLPEVVARWGLLTLDVPPLDKPAHLGPLFQEAAELAEQLDRLRPRRVERERTPHPGPVQAETNPSPRITAEQIRELCLALSSLRGQLPSEAFRKTIAQEPPLSERRSRSFFRTKSLENLEGRLLAALAERMDLAKRFLNAIAPSPVEERLMSPSRRSAENEHAIRVPPVLPPQNAVNPPPIGLSDEPTLLDFPPPARLR